MDWWRWSTDRCNFYLFTLRLSLLDFFLLYILFHIWFARSHQKIIHCFIFIHFLVASLVSQVWATKKKVFFTFISISLRFVISAKVYSLFIVLASASHIRRYTTMMKKSQKNSMGTFQDLFIIFQLFIPRWHALHIFSFRNFFSLFHHLIFQIEISHKSHKKKENFYARK